MSNWYIGGGSEFETGDKAQVWFNIDINGHATGTHNDYGTGDIEASDPYLLMENMGTVASPDPKAYFGLSGHYHLRIDENGIYGYHQGSGAWKDMFIGAPGVTDHGELDGLADDDHTQYHNVTRANTWLGTKSTTNLSEGSNLYHTTARVETIIDAEIVNGQSIDNAIDALINTHNVANRHIDHSAVSITAGVGLSGGGTIAANRTINCSITQYTDALAKAAAIEAGAYDETSWNANTMGATKDAIRDKIESMGDGGGLNNVVEDLTPELGGDLDCNQHKIIDLPAPSAVNDAARKTYVDAKVSDDVYGAGWNAVTTIAPSKKAVYDKIQSLSFGNCMIVSGTYTGNSSGTQRTISIGITAKFIAIYPTSYYIWLKWATIAGRYAERESGDAAWNHWNNAIEVITNAFKVGGDAYNYCNVDGRVYNWVAWG